ncbi:MAG: PorT family protein [Sphingobacteriales bacterium]|nr:MAG: PorT family protein [Sphingobacteriales bacterium]
MKKFLLSGIALSLSIIAQAQASKWSYGFQAGFGLSTVTNVYDAHLNSPSSGAGVQTLYKLNDHWQIGASLQFSRDSYKGNAVSNPFTLLSPIFSVEQLRFTQTETIDMVRLPLQLRYNWLSPGKKIRPYTYLGVSIGYNITLNEREIQITANDAYTQEFFNTTDVLSPSYSRLDYGMKAGTGLSLRTGQGTLVTTELYYYHGLKEQSNIIHGFLENEYSALNQRQQQLRVQIGFLVDL